MRRCQVVPLAQSAMLSVTSDNAGAFLSRDSHVAFAAPLPESSFRGDNGETSGRRCVCVVHRWFLAARPIGPISISE